MEFENLRLVRTNPFLACSQGGHDVLVHIKLLLLRRESANA